MIFCSCILKEASCCQCLRFTLGDHQGLSQSQIFSVIREPTSVSLFRRARMRQVLLFVFSSFSVSSSPPADVLNHRVKIVLKWKKHLVESIKGQTVKKKNAGLFFARVLLARWPFSLACFELNLSIFYRFRGSCHVMFKFFPCTYSIHVDHWCFPPPCHPPTLIMQNLLAQCVKWRIMYNSNVSGDVTTSGSQLEHWTRTVEPFYSSDSEGPYFALRVCWMIILLGCASAGPTQTSGTHNLNGPRPQSLFDFYPKWTLCGDKKKKKKKVWTRPLTHLKGSKQSDEIERRRSELCTIALIFTFVLCEGVGVGLGLDPPEQTIENVYVSSASPCLPSQVEKGREGKCFGCSLKKTTKKKNTVCSYDRSSDSVRRDTHPNTGKLQLYELL